MLDPRSDVEHEDQTFIKENEALLDEGSAVVLGRVFTQGANIATRLSGEAVEATDRATSATRALAEAVRSKSTPALKLHELDKERKQARELHEHKSAAFEELSVFLDRVNDLRQQRESEDGAG